MKKFLLSLGLIFVSLTLISRSERYSIAGMVVNESYQGISGATVALIGSAQYVTTNSNGTYTMSGVAIGDSISISFIGYKEQHIAVKGSPGQSGFINMGITVLEEDSE